MADNIYGGCSLTDSSAPRWFINAAFTELLCSVQSSFPSTLSLFFFFSDKFKWNYIGILLIPLCGFMLKLDCNEVWNLELGLKDWTPNYLYFCSLQIKKGGGGGVFISLLSLVTPFDRHQHAVITACLTIVSSFPAIHLWSAKQRLISPQWWDCEQHTQNLALKVSLFYYYFEYTEL